MEGLRGQENIDSLIGWSRFFAVVDNVRRVTMLCLSASNADSSTVNDLVTSARGPVYVAMPEHRIRALGIPPQLRSSTGSANVFTPVDGLAGTTTGISTSDRARTISALLDESSTRSDFRLGGHLTPVALHASGVFGRPRVPEAAADLCRARGDSAVVFATILGHNGDPADLDTARSMAEDLGAPVVSVSDVIRWRGKADGLPGAPLDLSSFGLTCRVESHIARRRERVAIAVVPLCPSSFLEGSCECADSLAKNRLLLRGRMIDMLALLWSQSSLDAACALQSLVPVMMGVGQLVAAQYAGATSIGATDRYEKSAE